MFEINNDNGEIPIMSLSEEILHNDSKSQKGQKEQSKYTVGEFNEESKYLKVMSYQLTCLTFLIQILLLLTKIVIKVC